MNWKMLPTSNGSFHLVRGHTAENQVVLELEKQSAEILFRNRRLPYGEVDIIAQKNEILYLVEVKTVGISTDIERRITRRQKRVLRYNRQWLEEEFKLTTKILWAFVSGQKIIWIRDEGE